MSPSQAILSLLAQRKPGASICPSEAARKMDPHAWRERMEEVRQAAALLAKRGELVITQRGQPVDLSTAKGPVRLRLPDAQDS